MCGRFSNNLTRKKIEDCIPGIEVNNYLEPSYNISPSQKSAIVIEKDNALLLGKIPLGMFPYGIQSGNEKCIPKSSVILKSNQEQMDWISNTTPTVSHSKIKKLMSPLSDNSLHIYKVSNAVNKPINNSLDLHREIPEQPTLF